MSLWLPTFPDIVENLIILAVIYFLVRARDLVIHLGGLVAAVNDRWGLRMAQRDFEQLQACAEDRQEIFHFALVRAGYWVTTLSAGFLFATLALMGHALFVAPIVFLIGLVLYLIAVQTTGLIHWSRHPDKFVPILQARIERIEDRIEARAARSKRNQAA